MKGPTIEDLERDAERADFEYDLLREDMMLNPHRYTDEGPYIPECTHPHDILCPLDAIEFCKFTESLRRNK